MPIFRVNKEEIQKGVGITHFGQVVKELDIELICAHSPQAKGRVERKNGVFQDRLIKEMRLRGISTIEDAKQNTSPEFLEEMNEKFGKEAESPEDAHRELRKTDDLQKVFFRKEKRTLSKKFNNAAQRDLVPDKNKYTEPDEVCEGGCVYTRRGKPIENRVQRDKAEL